MVDFPPSLYSNINFVLCRASSLLTRRVRVIRCQKECLLSRDKISLTDLISGATDFVATFGYCSYLGGDGERTLLHNRYSKLKTQVQSSTTSVQIAFGWVAIARHVSAAVIVVGTGTHSSQSSSQDSWFSLGLMSCSTNFGLIQCIPVHMLPRSWSNAVEIKEPCARFGHVYQYRFIAMHKCPAHQIQHRVCVRERMNKF